MRLRDIMSVGVITVVIGATLDQEHRDEVARKIGMKLGKFASSIERVAYVSSTRTALKGASVLVEQRSQPFRLRRPLSF
jgi:hypothetical protein